MDIQNFSDEQLVGQKLMVGFNGLELTKNLMYFIDTLKVGGIILFSRNIVSPGQLKDMCTSIKEYAASLGQPPPFIAIDQEGGVVSRLKEPFTRFEGNPAIQNHADARRFAEITASELSGVGINMNLAPVLDVAPEGINSVMKQRVFGHDPYRVADLGAVVIKELQKSNIIAVGKHFPGIGRTVLDSHLDLPILNVDLNALASFDLIPFKAAKAAGVSGMMLSHIRYQKIDRQWPASLSVEIAKTLLRDQMGFEQLVITDDLDMGAIKNHFNIETAISRIFAADIDIALICHESPKIEKAFDTLLKLISTENHNKQRALYSVNRILETKKAYL
jgi:beta-N-acetylhexosaminidase